MDSLDGVMHHLSDAWGRRHEPNVVLVHYDDLRTDLLGQMRRLAERLDLAHADDVTAELAAEASFGAMRRRAAELAPDVHGILEDPAAFFREGTSGAGAAELTAAALVRYQERSSTLAPPSLLRWLHR